MTLWLVREAHGYFPGDRTNLNQKPAPTVNQGGDLGAYAWWLEENGMRIVDESRQDGKPPYCVPGMAEIAALPQHGLKVVSTFTGAGGFCLGFRMAGFETAWASEFVPAAAEVYRFNFPGVPLDVRDIRKVRPEEILEAVGLEKGEVDVMEGSPPCASFSMAGKRDKHWGEVVKYSDTRQRVDDLFFEFARIVEGVQPRMFVAENVSGLVRGKAKGYFKEILARLRSCGYEVRAKLLDAQWLGVPQARRRIIFVGVRNDLGVGPRHPAPLTYRYSVADALPWIVRQGDNAGYGKGGMRNADVPDGTLGVSPQTGNGMFPPSIVEARVIHDEGGEWSTGDITDKPSPTVRQGHAGMLHVETKVIDPDTGEDLDISRYAIGREWDRLAQGEKGRYINFAKPRVGEPSPTVVAGDQAYNPMAAASVVHPVERRKFSIAELKRICAFPDDFVLTGSYARRWERLGRAVPPVMGFWIARSVREVLFGLDGREPWEHDPVCLVAGLNP